MQILDLIHAQPAVDPYGVLRECLIMIYTLNDYQRFEALVSLPLSGPLQTGLHPKGVVSPMPPHRCQVSSSPREGIQSLSSSPQGR